MVLKMIRQGRLVLFIGGKESQTNSEKTGRLESTQIRWFLCQSGGRLGERRLTQGLHYLRMLK
jgi:hypothetical protein